MANIRMGEVVKVLVEGYGVAPETLALVTGFSASGIQVHTIRYGGLHQVHTVPSFALRKHILPPVEMIWNRLRTKEDMIMRAMRRWGVTSILFEPTDIQGELFKITVNKGQERYPVRAKTIADALKMALTLAYFTKFDMRELDRERQRMLNELQSIREEVQAL